MARSLFAVLCLLAAPCAAFVATSLPRPAVVRRAAAPTALAFDPAAIQTIQLLAEILDEEGERVYGAVEAPLWVIPVGGILAIGTALLPVLLSPGEEAFSRQQGDESATGGQFGRGRGNQRNMRK